MPTQWDIPTRNAQLDAIETAIGPAPTLEIRTGAPPASCAAADSGTLLAALALPSDWLAAASGGSKALAGSWAGTASGTGTAGHYRLKDGSGSCRGQGTVYGAWTASTAYSVGQVAANGGALYTCTTAGTSASSGGPGGAGSGIADGSAVWSYSAPADMVLDNVSIAAPQAVAVSAYTITAGGA